MMRSLWRCERGYTSTWYGGAVFLLAVTATIAWTPFGGMVGEFVRALLLTLRTYFG